MGHAPYLPNCYVSMQDLFRYDFVVNDNRGKDFQLPLVGAPSQSQVTEMRAAELKAWEERMHKVGALELYAAVAPLIWRLWCLTAWVCLWVLLQCVQSPKEAELPTDTCHRKRFKAYISIPTAHLVQTQLFSMRVSTCRNSSFRWLPARTSCTL